MKHLIIFSLLLPFFVSCSNHQASRTTLLLEKDWKFINEEVSGAAEPNTSTTGWEIVSVPHDWAISGEFDKSIDAQETTVIEDGERKPRLRTGRTGALLHIGVGWYRKSLIIPESYKNKRIHLEFDGAMSHAKVYLN